MSDTSRDPNAMHDVLRERWEWMASQWAKRYPDLPKPFLTATYRGPNDQAKAFREGKSKAHFGASLHNFTPSFAFDVAFLGADGKADWSFDLFRKIGLIGEEAGLEWGGRWPDLVDGPHFQLPMSIAAARRGEVPELPPLGSPEARRKLVVMRDGHVNFTMPIEDNEDVVVRYSQTRERVHVDVRKEGR